LFGGLAVPGPIGGVNSAPPDPSLDLREGNGQGKEQDGESMEGRGGNGWSERVSTKGGRVGGCGGREGRRDRRSEGGRGGNKEGNGRDDRTPQISQRGYANDVWSCWSGRNSMGSLFCETRNSSEHMPPVGGVAQW